MTIKESLGEASLAITIPLDKFEKKLKAAKEITEEFVRKATKALDKVGKKLVSVGKSFSTKLSAPLIAFGVVASKVTAGFDDSLAKIVGLVGVAESQVRSWREEILRLGPAVGKGPAELAEAMFFVTSAGKRGEAAMDVLEKSAKAASAGLGETAKVADAATSAMNAYGDENLSAGKAVGILVGTVREGKAEAESIATAIGSVLGIAAELGVSFDQVGASIAAMTRLGTSADESVTALRATFNSILKPVPDAEKAIEALGLDFETLKDMLAKPGGLLNVLTLLRERMEGTDVEISRIFPNVRALVGVLGLVGKNAEQTKEIFKSLSEDGVESLNRAFENVTKEAGFKFNQAMARINASLIRMGDVILPVVVPLIEKVSKSIEKAGIAFSKLSANTKAWVVILTGVAIVLGPVLIGLGFMIISIVAISKAIGFLGISFSKIIKFMLKPIKLLIAAIVGIGSAVFSLPGIIIIGLASVIGAFLIFKDTISGLASGIVAILKKALIADFNNIIVIPFKNLLNDIIDVLPQAAKDLLGITDKLSVPDVVEQTFIEEFKALFAEAFENGSRDAEAFATGFKNIISTLGDKINSILPDLSFGIDSSTFQDVEEQFEKLIALFDKVKVKATESSNVIEEKFAEAGKAAGEEITSSVEDMILGFKNLGDIIKNVADIIKQELLRALIAKPVAKFFGELFAGAFSTGKAGGGDINGPTIVGERGPEIVNPKGPATVINNVNSKSKLGGGNVVKIHQTINFTTDVKNSVRAEILNNVETIANETSRRVFDQMDRASRG